MQPKKAKNLEKYMSHVEEKEECSIKQAIKTTFVVQYTVHVVHHTIYRDL